MRRSHLTLVVAGLLALAYALALCLRGVPVLRHDWWWPANYEMALETLVDSTSGWLPTGMGMPAAYPGGYIVGPIIAVMTIIGGGVFSLFLFTFATAITATLGARELGKHFDANSYSVIAAQALAVFNPWVYNETVAGHLYMVLAYGACIAIAAELLRPRVQSARIALLLVLTVPQLQIFLVAMIFVAIHALLRRVALPIVSGIIYGLPIWVGIALDRSSLLKTPYTVVWQTAQSVPILDALTVRGYFAHYASVFGGAQIAALWVIVACAASPLLFRSRRTVAIACCTLAAVCILIASGTQGPFSRLYTAMVLYVPETGVFRELYDLIGIVAIAYVVLLVCQPPKLRVVAVASLVAAGIVGCTWITNPVSNYWVGRSALPVVSVRAAAETRYALVPAYEPMQFHGEGSGADPDSYLRLGNVTPVNEYFALYPVTTALSSYLVDGDVKPLENLSVSVIVTRPWLQTNADALRHTMSGELPSEPQMRVQSRQLDPLPEVTLVDIPAVGGVVNRPGAGNIFFADARRVRSPLAPPSWSAYPEFLPETAPSLFVDDAQGWVDAELAFTAHPDLGQGVGGLVTSSPSALLRIVPGVSALVNVRGQLFDANGNIVSSDTHGYAWVRIQKDAEFLRCSGRCAVAGQARLTTYLPPNPAPRTYLVTQFATLAPWLVRVSVPANSPPVLRYNTAYDDSWIAIARGRRTAHIRLDATINGWLLSPNSRGYTVYLLHLTAAIQCACEIVAIIWMMFVASQLSSVTIKK